MLELHNRFLSLKASYTFLGNYHLSDATFAGYSDLAYENPQGEKVTLLMRLMDGAPFWAGIYYGQVRYDWSNFATSPLPLQSWQAGLVFELRILEDNGRGSY